MGAGYAMSQAWEAFWAQIDYKIGTPAAHATVCANKSIKARTIHGGAKQVRATCALLAMQGKPDVSTIYHPNKGVVEPDITTGAVRQAMGELGAVACSGGCRLWRKTPAEVAKSQQELAQIRLDTARNDAAAAAIEAALEADARQRQIEQATAINEALASGALTPQDATYFKTELFGGNAPPTLPPA